MIDYKYEKLVIDESYREIGSKIGTEKILPTVTSFVQNVNRIVSLSKMPPALVFWSMMLDRIATNNYNKIEGSSMPLYFEQAEYLKKNKENAIKLRSEFEKEFSDLKKFSLESKEQFWERLWKKGNSNLQSFDYMLHETISEALESVFSGMVTGMWTAFETLAGDLWEGAVNAEPAILSKLKGQANKPKPKDDQDSLKKIDLDLIHRYKYDLKSCMGTVLRCRFSFTALEGIREAYTVAFSEDGEKVAEAIKDRVLFRLSSVRNAIVHKAGIADEKFTKEMKSDPEFSHVAIGKPIPINGEITQSLIDPAVGCTAKLIIAVDEWLTLHPGGKS